MARSQVGWVASPTGPTAGGKMRARRHPPLDRLELSSSEAFFQRLLLVYTTVEESEGPHGARGFSAAPCTHARTYRSHHRRWIDRRTPFAGTVPPVGLSVSQQASLSAPRSKANLQSLTPATRVHPPITTPANQHMLIHRHAHTYVCRNSRKPAALPAAEARPRARARTRSSPQQRPDALAHSSLARLCFRGEVLGRVRCATKRTPSTANFTRQSGLGCLPMGCSSFSPLGLRIGAAGGPRVVSPTVSCVLSVAIDSGFFASTSNTSSYTPITDSGSACCYVQDSRINDTALSRLKNIQTYPYQQHPLLETNPTIGRESSS
ncbi:hypothetical protein BKA81DRAFT_377741 [Phyllosticta paracitricarpa]|uniref:Uncharacterized protein n=1 Tax=Phyllosticta citricarpa TaxID=55181 RepID=A0ABR1MD67_9PEZI